MGAAEGRETQTGGAARARVSLRAVRYGLAGVGLALVGVIAGFVGYARHRAQAYLRGLPGRLGVHVTQESDNVTYSESYKGRTIYTVHAAKQIQHTDGKYTLRDVGIVMYGVKGDRADRIHGSEFEWDQKAAVMRAVGPVFIDLGAPAAKKGEDAEARMIHVKTRGLVFREKEKSAATEEEVEFSNGELSGKAMGASYDSESGVVVLRSAVRMSGLRRGIGRPMSLTAGRAEMDRVGNVVKLDGAKVVSAKERGEQTGSAERAVVHLTAEGAPTSVEAEGQVTLTEDGQSGGRGTVQSRRLEAELNAAGQMTGAHFAGDVRFAAESGLKQDRGQAGDARIAFDGQGRARHAAMTGRAELNEVAGANQRRLEAAKVELALGGGGKEPVAVTGVVASGEGGARLRLVDGQQGKDKRGTTDTAVRADVLTARFGAAGVGVKGGAQLAGMDGVGKTSVEQVARDGKGEVESTETSTGDALTMEFRAGAGGRSELVRAEQRGGVRVARESKTKSVRGAGGDSAGPEVERARGEVAVYEKDADRLTMTGGVEVSDAGSALFAERVVTNRASGETTADGEVRVSYLEAGSAGEPVHVVAARAVSHTATGLTEFFAVAGGRAKMWQGGSQVEAPVLDFDRAKKTMVARDERGADGAVRAVLVDASGGSGGAPTHVSEAKHAAAGSLAAPKGPVRVTGREMTYRDAAREVEFRGKVTVQDQDGTMRADAATVYLAPAGGAGGSGVNSSHVSEANHGAPIALGGKLERMVGVGGVEIEQPGRRATGERLVYTAADGTFVLTGTKAAPPKMVDETHGTTTGAELRFKSGEDRVTVTGTEAGSDTRRVRSETRVKQ